MIHAESCECGVGGTEFFESPPTQTVVEGRKKVDFFPVANVTDLGPLEFLVTSADDDYYDLNDHCLELKIKIVKRHGGADIVAADKVGPINFFLHSIFSQIDIHINGQLVSVASSTYPYKVYFEKQLNYDENIKETQFASGLYAKDTAGKMDSLTANKGFTARAQYTALSKTVQLRGRLHVDIFNQERFLPNRCSLRLKLIPHTPAFFLLSDKDEYAIKLESARFELTKVKINPAVLNQHNMTWTKTPAKFPIRRSEIKTFSIPTGNMQTVRENLFSGQVPRRIVIGLVDTEAFSGKISKNPFNFQHYDLNFLCAHVDGERFPSRPLTPDFDNGHFLEAYETLFVGTGVYNTDRTIDIKRQEFAHGYAMYIIRLMPGEPDAPSFDLVQNGSVRLELKFKDPIPSTATAIVQGSK